MKTIYKYLTAFFAVLLPLLAYGASETSNPYDKVTQGKSTASDKDYIFNIGAGSANPRLRAKASTNKLQFAHDGVTFKDIGSGGGAGGGGVVLNSNTGFEEGLTNWAASGGTFTLETTAANVGFATQAGAWDASAASQTLSNDAITVPAGLFGKTCSLSWYYKGGDANLSAQVYDGTNVIAQSSVFSAQTTYSAKQVMYFTCPSSGTMQARFIASANAAIIYLDDVKLGQETLTAAGSDVDTDWVAYTPTFTGFGTPSSVNFLWRRVGDSVEITGRFASGTPTGTEARISLPSGLVADTSKVGSLRASGVYFVSFSTSAKGGAILIEPTVSYFTFGSHNAFSGNTVDPSLKVNANTIVSASDPITIERVLIPISGWSAKPPGAQDSIALDQSGWRIDANIGGANIDLGTGTISTYTEITDAGLDLVIASGSAGAEIPCSSTNPSTGLTCAAGSESVGLAFTPPSAGTYEVCSAVIHNANLAATGTAQVNFQLVETPNNSQTILQEGNQRNQSGMDTTSGALNLEFPNYVCGVFNFSDTSKRTIRLMREQVTGGTVNNNRVRADRSTANGQRDIHFKVRRRVEFADVVKFTNMVTTGRALGMKVAFLNFAGATESTQCTSSPCVIYQTSGDATGVTRTGAGAYSIAWPSGFWAVKPICTAVANSTSASRNPQYDTVSSSTTASIVKMYDPGVGFSDAGAVVNCMGY